MKKKRKILFVLTVLNRGGLETMLLNYFRNFDQNQFEFHFLVHRESGDYEMEILESGGFIHRLLPLNFSVSNFLKYRKQLDDFFRKNTFDIVHVHNNSFGYYPLKYARKNGIKICIMHSHISSLKDDWKKILLGKYLNQKIPKVATELYACGNDAGKWMYGNLPFEVIPNAIDTEKFRYNTSVRSQLRKELGVEDALCFLNVARFQTQKNHLFLLEIFSEMVKIQPNAKLFLVGDGDLKSAIEQKISDLHLQDSVMLLGVRSDVNELLQAADVFLFPSLFEGLPVSLVEAQTSGIRCTISDGISGESILVEENVQVISLKKSPKHWAEEILAFSRYGRRDVSDIIREKGYDIKENAKRLERKYEELLGLKFEV